jgi:hypothetical protein
MDRYGRNNDYRGNAHMHPSVIISSRKAHYRNDDLSSRTQESLQSNTTSSTTNSSSYLYPKAGKTRELKGKKKERERELTNRHFFPTYLLSTPWMKLSQLYKTERCFT